MGRRYLNQHTGTLVEDTEKQLKVNINKSIAHGAEISVNQ